MAQTPPAKAPTGPKVSGTRTIVSLVFLVVVLVVCVIELRAGLGQFLTLRSFNKVSDNNQFKNVPFADAEGMVAAFPSKSDVQPGNHEDMHHYYWYSLLRPMMGQKNPEIFVFADHASPPAALSFTTSTEDETFQAPVDPNASPAMTNRPPGGAGGMGMGMGMSGPPSDGPPGGGRPGGGGKGGAGRPPLEDEAPATETKDPAATDPAKTEGESVTTPTEPAPTEPAPTEPAPTEPAPTEPDSTTEPTGENEKPETPATPK